MTTLLDLIEHGTGGAAYYSDVMEALVSLAVCAPCGPPVNSADFLARLDPDWLAMVYGASGDGAGVATARSSAKAFNDVQLRFAALWRRLGGGLDGCATYADADAWYCVLEGTAEAAVAEAQARALTDLLAFYALDGEREILLCVDEFSAVSRRLPIWQLYERARSLGLAVQVSAQSWEGLAGTRGRAEPGRRHRRGRHLAAAHAAAGPGGGTGGDAALGRHDPAVRRGRAPGPTTGCRGPGWPRSSTAISCGGLRWARSPTSTAAA